MKKILILILILTSFSLAKTASAQLTQATGDDFTIAVYNDIHTDNNVSAWTNAVDWLLGVNGHGPSGVSALSYWNIKAVAGLGDYVTACNDTNWNSFLSNWNRISALGLPGIWTQGNHDLCSQYTATFGSTDQSVTLNVSTSLGVVKLGLVGVGVADDMTSGQASRTYVDGVLSASEANRQWIFLRHVGTYAAYASPGPYVYPANGNSGWCFDSTTCLYAGQTGADLRDSFYQHESKIFWGVHGHVGYVAVNSLTADDGHVVNVTGNQGASGSTPGWITLMKFRPSHHDIQMAVYLSYDGVTGSLYSGPYTWAWTPNIASTTSRGLFPLPSPIGTY
jgi:hypothetical protein